MALTYYIKNGFSNIRALVTSVVNDMVSSTFSANNVTYFECVYPPSFTAGSTLVFPSGTTYPEGNVLILESKLAIDPLANVNTVTLAGGGTINAAWRLAFVLHDDKTLTVHAGTRLTLPGIESASTLRGNLVFLTNRATNPNQLEFREPAGCLNTSPWSQYDPTKYKIFGNVAAASISSTRIDPAVLPGPNVQIPSEVFISRLSSAGAESAYPMNYSLTMSSRGMVLCVWEDNQEEIPETPLTSSGYGLSSTSTTDLSLVYGNSPVRWFAIQRAVDRETGQVRGGYRLRGNVAYSTGGVINEKSRCPVFCVFGADNPNQYRKFVVRENDVLVPSPKRPASVNTVDSPAILNPLQQQSVTEQGEFVVTFLNNLSTSRFRYGDEMDLIGTVGAEVVGGGTNIEVKVYQDGYTRTYSALYANRQYGNGMRVMVLTKADYRDEDKNTGLVTSSGVLADVTY